MTVSKVEKLFGTNDPVAFVTGSGAKRVGNCIAMELAKCGYHLVLHANHSVDLAKQTAEEIESMGRRTLVVTGDVSQEADVQVMFESIKKRFDRLDVLVNSAAIWYPTKLEDITADEVRRYLEINTLGSFLCCQIGGLIMVGQPHGGVVINIGDWSPTRPYLNYAAYFPSKGAIPALSRSLAVELGSRNPNIRVNVIHPGPVMIPHHLPDVEKEKIIQSTLVKREGSPQNIADAAIALIENDFITGAELHVDGGRSIFSSDQDAATVATKEH